jgi:hypothetical protein
VVDKQAMLLVQQALETAEAAGDMEAQVEMLALLFQEQADMEVWAAP